MHIPLGLILVPLAAAFILLALGRTKLRKPLVIVATTAFGLGSLHLLFNQLSKDALLVPFDETPFLTGFGWAGLLIGAFLLERCIRFRQPLAALLVLTQTGLAWWAEHLTHLRHNPVGVPLIVDHFSAIMAAIIGIIGGLICVHAVGYMKDWNHHHDKLPDRRNQFFFLLFLFISAMFGLVFANSLPWFVFFWEVTTLCSFLLIGYARDAEAMKSAFLALRLNLIGGIAMTAGWLLILHRGGSLDMLQIVASGDAMYLLPVVLLCIAGLAKSAQFPFSGWLLGAMVAPTPVSAMLHASTMVKAGVYVIIRFAPVLQDTMAGLMISLIGATTFLLTSLAAIGQSNAKRVLAYSTIANLGLIVTCAGTGQYNAIWAAILLVIFHAVAKALLFLAVGTVEHRLGSRDIEDMDGLVMRHPALAVAMLVGIAGMFLAPFGLLISKWAALEALIVVNPILPIFVVFGSSATLFFWAKWMGKMIGAEPGARPVPDDTHSLELIVLAVLTALVIICCAVFPWIAEVLIDPYVLSVYGRTMVIGRETMVIMSIMLLLVALLPLSLLYRGGERFRRVSPYLAGANYEHPYRFTGSAGKEYPMGMKNYYLAEYLPELPIRRWGTIACLVMMAVLMGVAL
ncbi:MAG TPA: proton-conducting transporter membrane subunit [Kiritimatiellia bacterium]|nr:proton-conducting transporter membrane subunit [Kiritimatiellia bacterium]HMO99982.1 proton-conducting transporter membrane subunit [Kiritimatiellia bacterium]HMP96925.1 proton-conducting transporter membrane subunit [Kiritimatiellia bacterium]